VGESDPDLWAQLGSMAAKALLSNWDPEARVIEATFEAVGTGLEGATIDIDGSISLAAQGAPCDLSRFDCMAKFQ
jgi:hypothetical protein